MLWVTPNRGALRRQILHISNINYAELSQSGEERKGKQATDGASYSTITQSKIKPTKRQASEIEK
jgi:hypothetical protein